MLQLGILASHTGTNFQVISDACQSGKLDADVALLVTNNSRAPVADRARKAGIPVRHLSSKTHGNPSDLDTAMCSAMTDAGVDLVVLAGYMRKLGPRVLSTFEDRIINVHPSLLPRYGGAGFYGDRVHEAVLQAGDSETGATVHLVNEAYDEGAIILQESIPVRRDDTTETLATRVRPLEHRLLLAAITQFAQHSLTGQVHGEKNQ